MNIQQPFANKYVVMQPLQPTDFEQLYAAANDKLLWAQHPNPDRYQRAVFLNFFEGAIKSGGAYLVLDAATKKVIGSTRFYDYKPDAKQVTIGYTFVVRSHWGKPYNKSMKALMVNYALQFVQTVHFHIGAENLRSQMAIAKIGATKIGEINMAYYGEPEKLNFIYILGQPINL
jgi:RimJ/RimL family protein N-acetyltransferase